MSNLQKSQFVSQSKFQTILNQLQNLNTLNYEEFLTQEDQAVCKILELTREESFFLFLLCKFAQQKDKIQILAILQYDINIMENEILNIFLYFKFIDQFIFLAKSLKYQIKQKQLLLALNLNHMEVLLYYYKSKQEHQMTHFMFNQLLQKLQDSQSSLEIIIYLLKKNADDHFKYSQIQIFLKFIDQRFLTDEQFLSNVAEPFKISVLLIDLIKKIKYPPNLKHDVKTCQNKLIVLSTELQNRITCQQTLRYCLFSLDIENRTILQIISDNSVTMLFSHPFVSQLTRETWEGPYITDKTPFFNSSNYDSIKYFSKYWNFTNQTLSQSREKKTSQLEQKNKECHSFFQYISWRDGLSFRFYKQSIIFLVLILYIQVFLQLFIQDVRRIIQLYWKEISPTLQLGGFPSLQILIQYVNLVKVLDDNKKIFYTLFQLFYLIPIHYAIKFLYFKLTRRRMITIINESLITDALLFFFTVYGYFVISIPLTKKSEEMDQKEATFFSSAQLMINNPLIVFSNPLILLDIRQSIQPFMDYPPLMDDIHTPFHLSMIIGLLWLRIFFAFRVSTNLGPFIEILKTSFISLLTWLVMFFLSLISFSFILFILTNDFFQWNSQNLTATTTGNSKNCIYFRNCFSNVFVASLGSIDYTYFQGSTSILVIYTLSIIIHTIMLLNLLIGMLGDTYNLYMDEAQYHYSKQIFKIEQEMKLDNEYGILNAVSFPFSSLSIVFLFMVCIKKTARVKLNQFLLKMLYVFQFIFVFFIILIAQLLLLPFAFIAKVLINFRAISKLKGKNVSRSDLLCKALIYLIFGIFECLFQIGIDIYSLLKVLFQKQKYFRVNYQKNKKIHLDLLRTCIKLAEQNENERKIGLNIFKEKLLKQSSHYKAQNQPMRIGKNSIFAQSQISLKINLLDSFKKSQSNTMTQNEDKNLCMQLIIQKFCCQDRDQQMKINLLKMKNILQQLYSVQRAKFYSKLEQKTSEKVFMPKFSRSRSVRLSFSFKGTSFGSSNIESTQTDSQLHPKKSIRAQYLEYLRLFSKYDDSFNKISYLRLNTMIQGRLRNKEFQKAHVQRQIYSIIDSMSSNHSINYDQAQNKQFTT